MGLFNLEKRKLHRNFIVVFQYLKEPAKKDEDKLFSRPLVLTRGNGFKPKEGRFRLNKMKIFTMSVMKQEQVAQRGGRYPIPGYIQGQDEKGSAQTDLDEHVLEHYRAFGLDDEL